MIEFTTLAFGLCAAVLSHAGGMRAGIDPGLYVAIGTLKDDGKECSMFFIGAPTGGDAISLNGHAMIIDKMENGFMITIDNRRFMVAKAEKI